MPGPLYRNLHTADGGILSVAFLDLLPQQVLSTAHPTPVTAGAESYETDTFALMQYQSATTGWTPIWNLAWGIVATPVTTGSASTATSTTVETRDAVLGNYVFTAVANRQYEVHLKGAKVSSTVANDLTTTNIRDGGGSTPTASSTLLASSATLNAVVGGPGQIGVYVSAPFTATAGTHTLSVFNVRSAGTGVETNVGTRQLYVVDIGPSANPA